MLPGVGVTVAAFMSYAIEKKVAKDPSRFGKGAIEGIVGPESTNNAADQTAFIPTMTLGVPGSATMALILGALMVHGISPGPTMIVQRPELFWGLVMSFWIGNIMLLILNVPMIGLWIRLLTVPYHLLFPAVVTLVCVGIYAVNGSAFEVATVIAFGALGYGARLLGFSIVPLLLGYVLGPMMEEHFRRAMIVSHGSFEIFVARPISAGLLLLTLLILLAGLWSAYRSRSVVEEMYLG
jgi:TctA family transporter